MTPTIKVSTFRLEQELLDRIKALENYLNIEFQPAKNQSVPASYQPVSKIT